MLSFTPVGQKALVTGQSREVARLTAAGGPPALLGFVLGAAIPHRGIAYAAADGTVDPSAGSA